MIMLLSPYDEAYAFRLVNMVTLICLDISWLATATINPGIIPKSKQDDYNCIVCKYNANADELVTTPSHCRDCNTCIEERAHHCAITGGCIGRGNKIPFYLFMIGVMVWLADLLATLPYITYLK